MEITLMEMLSTIEWYTLFVKRLVWGLAKLFGRRLVQHFFYQTKVHKPIGGKISRQTVFQKLGDSKDFCVKRFSNSNFLKYSRSKFKTLNHTYSSGWLKQELCNGTTLRPIWSGWTVRLKVHKIENFFGSDYEFSVISLLVMLKY